MLNILLSHMGMTVLDFDVENRQIVYRERKRLKNYHIRV